METAGKYVKIRKGGWTMGDRKKKKMSTEEIHGLTYNMVTHALWILFTVAFVLAIVYGAKRAYDFGYAVFSTKDRAVRGTEVTISILEGSSVMTVGRQLEKNGYLDDCYVFWAQSVLFDYEVNPGVYTFNSKSSSRALLELFDKGPETTDE